MKRMILVVAAVLSMTTMFAEDEKVNSTNVYDMRVNMRKLGEALSLSLDQEQSVKDIHKEFCAEMQNAANAGKEERDEMVAKAVHKDVTYMRYVLSRKQFQKYLLLLNTTLNNRGLNK
ncbi:MAG: hypothetical protein J5506_07515 [Prevotella sp.]|nr:hypothetical protein [Prevotella sp.]